MFPVTLVKKEKLELVFATFVQVSMAAPSSLLWRPGSLKALIYISLFNVSFLRGYYANVPYISKSNTVFNLLHLFA